MPNPVVVDLDVLEQGPKRGERPAPFYVNAKRAILGEDGEPTGKTEPHRILLRDVQDLDWEVVADLSAEQPRDFIYAVIEADDDLNLFFDQHYTLRQMNSLMERYMKHYAVLDMGKRGASRAR